MCNSQKKQGFSKRKERRQREKYCSHGTLKVTVLFIVTPAEIVYSKENKNYKFKNKTKLEGILGMLTAT